jgi:hypothetical protein
MDVRTRCRMGTWFEIGYLSSGGLSPNGPDSGQSIGRQLAL